MSRQRVSDQGSGAVAADQLTVLLTGQPAAVVDQETARAGEFVVLLGQHPDGELLAGQAGEVGAGKFEGLVELGLVHVDRPGLGLGATRLQFFERILAQFVDFTATRCVVVGGHLLSAPSWGRSVMVVVSWCFTTVRPDLAWRGIRCLRRCNAWGPRFVPSPAERLSNGVWLGSRRGLALVERGGAGCEAGC